MFEICKYEYQGHSIVVENKWENKLVIDNQTVDSFRGVAKLLELKGKLSSGEEVVAVIGTPENKLRCKVTIAGIPLEPVDIS